MADTKKLRIQANNEWPARVVFPAEHAFQLALRDLNVTSPILPYPLNATEDRDFHRFTASILDGFDSLPYRPDRAFDSFWVAVDAETLRLQIKGGPSRFPALFTLLRSGVEVSSMLDRITSLLSNIPLQSCEYAAIRITDAFEKNDRVSDSFLNRLDHFVSPGFSRAFGSKYLPRLRGQSANEHAGAQRQAGFLMRKVFLGEPIEMNEQPYDCPEHNRLGLYVSCVLPTMRNERFHGIVFSSYRSSAAGLKNYASDYLAAYVSYYLILAIMLLRWPDGFDRSSFDDHVLNAKKNFELLFANQLKK